MMHQLETMVRNLITKINSHQTKYYTKEEEDKNYYYWNSTRHNIINEYRTSFSLIS